MSKLEDIKARLRSEQIRVAIATEAIIDLEYACKMLQAKGLRPDLQHTDCGDALAMWLVVRIPLEAEADPAGDVEIHGWDLGAPEPARYSSEIAITPETPAREFKPGCVIYGQPDTDAKPDCPVSDPDCLGEDGDCHDACEPPAATEPEAPAEPATVPEPAPDQVVAPTEPAPALRSGPWSDAEELHAIELMREGKDAREIGRIMGRDARGVGAKMRFLRSVTASQSDAPDVQDSARADEQSDAPEPPAPDVAKVYAPIEAEGPMPGVGAPPLPVDIEALPVAQRAVERRLRRLGYPAPHSPLTDLWLVMALVGGAKLDGAAENAGLPREDAKARWHALLPEVTIEAQNALVAVLRARTGKGAP